MDLRSRTPFSWRGGKKRGGRTPARATRGKDKKKKVSSWRMVFEKEGERGKKGEGTSILPESAGIARATAKKKKEPNETPVKRGWSQEPSGREEEGKTWARSIAARRMVHEEKLDWLND